MELIDFRQVATQIVGFLALVWILRRYAWGPIIRGLEERREKIAGEFQSAEQKRTEALELKAKYEQELRGIEALSRQKLQEAVTEGQKVAAEIKAQGHQEAQDRMKLAESEITREREKAKEQIKEYIIDLSMRSAEKILREKLDDATHRKLVGEFINEVGAAG